MSSLKKSAIQDLRYLLNRGYPRSSAVKFVGDRYLLNKPQRLLLYRGVFPDEIANMRRSKLVGPERVSGSRLSIDGFNVLWTVSSAMRGDPVYICDDGLIRDLSGIHGSVEGRQVSEPLEIIVSTVSSLRPREVLFFFDKSISRSGEIAGEARRLISHYQLTGNATTVPSPDHAVLTSGEIIATSDSVVADKAASLFDLAGYIIKTRLNVKPLPIEEL
ncbi:MAG: DUF434 domain-containing protein [Candidatus Methanomethylicia archaeon]|jgi:hypothetical protein|nr:DUF434 domain-containing protein [Candidatus Methanomethylicia archaeon]